MTGTAVELDPQCANCQGTLGLFLFYHDWQFARAEPHLVEALRLDLEAASIRPWPRRRSARAD